MSDESFPIYKDSRGLVSGALRKVNAQRRALSLVQVETVALTRGSVLFSTAEEAHDEPRSCYNCPEYNFGESCHYFGPAVRIRKFTFPVSPTADAKPIEYWPVCGLWQYGKPNRGDATFHAELVDPDNNGLAWINAPKPGQEMGGTNCGGQNGGDNCDWFTYEGENSRAAATGRCKVLNIPVLNGDCCTAWSDDDILSWQKAQAILKELNAE